jgi:hypothetical protein
MIQQSRKTIVVTEQNFEALRKMGTFTESFNDIISRLLQNQIPASGQSPLVGSTGQDAVVNRNDQRDGGHNG